MIVGIVAAGLILLGFAFAGRPYRGWVLAGSTLLVAWAALDPGSWLAWGVATTIFAAAALAFAATPWRQRWIARRVMPALARRLPRLGATERIALEAGTVGWDGELFSGAPAWPTLLAAERSALSEEERAYLDGPVEALCRRLDEWSISQAGDLPEDVWETLRRERFFGLIIPKAHGGLGFSAQAHAAVVTKLASRSITAAVTVMVPNSLGPGELLVHYGTDAQRERYLHRLARGEEIPCFALTGPEAGSDAAATQSEGIVCHGKWAGEEVLGLRLTWRKRYITLAPVATLIGLAFRLRDPDGLLGGEADLGITCALVPADLPGIEIGARHDPMGVPFQNGPTSGQDVFVPIDAIIGGREGAGQGWRMLMESLSAGRSISLPSMSVAGTQLATRLVSAYAMVREQFDTPIGRFEGIEEPLARMAGLTYAVEATRSLTTMAVDAGGRPAVLSAIAKTWCTELMRTVVNDAMDVRAGAGIMRGPRNVLGRIYQTIPIGITVEGANILTRSMIIYGQGAIRCHPWVWQEIQAVEAGDVARFDRAFFGHLGFVAQSAARSLLLGLSRGRLARATSGRRFTRRATQRLGRASASFALVSDAAMATLGGSLKRREKLTGRLADVLAWLTIGSAVVKRFHDGREPESERAFAEWALAHALAEIDRALADILRNLPVRPIAWLLTPLVFPLGRREHGPDDTLGGRAARALLDDESARARLTAEVFVPAGDELGLGRIEAALAKARPALAIEARLRRAVAEGRLDRAPGDALVAAALDAGILTPEDVDLLAAADEARAEAIAVDAFEPDAFPERHR
ncbi:MAG: acyl-CoA dehydrogenase [Myxococcota bacterium]